MSRVVGVYVCPRGIFGVECRRRAAGLEVLRSFDAHGRVATVRDAARQLGELLAQHDIKRSEIAIAVRGFGAGHHVLSFPRAADSLLDAIVAREVRRIEPQMTDPAVAWTRLADEDDADADQHDQADVLAAALPQAAARELTTAIRAAGHSLLHLTVLSVAVHRLTEEFVPPDGTTALVAQLPDGPFIGFTVDGAIRLAVEPPVHQDDELPDAAALADEAELGTVFVRQQFRGAQVTRATVIASNESYPELESALGARLEVPINRLPLTGLSPGGVAAFGAVLDARARHPVALAGRTVQRGSGRSAAPMQFTTLATLVVAAIAGVWALSEALIAQSAATALRDARRRIGVESSNFAPARETADRRKLVRDAVTALQVAQGDRSALQRSVASIAGTVTDAVSLDSLVLEHGPSGWQAIMGGRVAAQTNGLAVQSLSTFYRDLSRLVSVESLSLRRLSYADTTGTSLVHFEIMFGVLLRPRS